MDGIEIRIARIRSGLKQYQLAQAVGMRANQLSLIENNRASARPDELHKIRVALKLEPMDRWAHAAADERS